MSVWTELWSLAKRVLMLAEDLKRYESELKDVRKELRDLSLVVQLLAQELRHSQEKADSERARLLLEVENRLLRMSKGLPPADEHSDPEAG